MRDISSFFSTNLSHDDCSAAMLQRNHDSAVHRRQKAEQSR